MNYSISCGKPYFLTTIEESSGKVIKRCIENIYDLNVCMKNCNEKHNNMKKREKQDKYGQDISM